MTQKQRSKLPLFSTKLTATVSVTLVLMILGAVAMIGIMGNSLATDLRQHLGFALTLDEDATPADIAAMKQRFTGARYVASYTYSSPEQVMERWQQMVGDDENITELMEGINPFAPEFEVHVKALWAHPDSLSALAQRLEMIPGVAEVKVHTEMVEQVNRTVTTIALCGAGFAIVLLIISFVLINNTVRLTVYSRRFTIYTMKLVGATGAFIRRPIVMANILAGLIAVAVASGLLAGLLAWSHSVSPAMREAVSWPMAAWVFAGMIVAGVLICYVASALATNKYLRLSHDDMFR